MVRRYSSGIDDPVDAFRPLGNERSIVMLGVDTAMQEAFQRQSHIPRQDAEWYQWKYDVPGNRDEDIGELSDRWATRMVLSSSWEQDSTPLLKNTTFHPGLTKIAVAWGQSHEQDKYEGGSGALEQRRHKKEEETKTSRATSPLPQPNPAPSRLVFLHATMRHVYDAFPATFSSSPRRIEPGKTGPHG